MKDIRDYIRRMIDSVDIPHLGSVSSFDENGKLVRRYKPDYDALESTPVDILAQLLPVFEVIQRRG